MQSNVEAWTEEIRGRVVCDVCGDSSIGPEDHVLEGPSLNTGKSNSGARSGAKSEARKDRKSGTSMSGSPKKGGHGGNFTWSGSGYSLAEIGS
ncbi:hypothetical protein LWI29_025972 [Acer saccharum]|uniref:Uncharacterized protein n=1 Tax=Acer saccharum TaxID=4024 RepID=A0AA39SN48_ACESA|nr:hypothetical protein LWI29_025972 [Acer saccharum]